MSDNLSRLLDLAGEMQKRVPAGMICPNAATIRYAATELAEKRTELTDLRMKRGFRDVRIEALEAAVRKGCEYLHDFQWYGISIDESKYIREYLAEMAKLLGSVPETEAKDE